MDRDWLVSIRRVVRAVALESRVYYVTHVDYRFIDNVHAADKHTHVCP